VLNTLRQNSFLLFGIVLSTAAYWYLVQEVDRTDSLALFSSCAVAFTGYFCWIRQPLSFYTALFVGVGMRFIFWDSLPELSQDFYRFLWDGQLQKEGINPYAFKPIELIENRIGLVYQHLFEGMGSLSQQHYSNYPPASQWLYYLSARLGGTDLLTQIAVMRAFLIGGDIAAFVALRKILRHYRLPLHYALFYFLNPLLLLEGSWNLHGEGLMLAATAWGIWFYLQKRWWASGGFFALGVALKLLPLLWLPILLQPLKWKERGLLVGYGGLWSLLFWMPYFSIEYGNHFLESIRLWFSNFEFNASVYYLVREWGYYDKGYNIIRKLGKITPWVLTALVVLFSLWPQRGNNNRIWARALGLMSIYYMTATTVHPWYLLHLVFLGVLTPYRYAILWSATVLLSYATYADPNFVEPIWLVWVEYLPVYGLLLWEILKKTTFRASANGLFLGR